MHSGIIGSLDLSTRDWVAGVEGHRWEVAQVYSDPRRPTHYFIVEALLSRQTWPLTGSGDFVLGWGTPSFTPSGDQAVHPVASDPRTTSATVLAGSFNP